MRRRHECETIKIWTEKWWSDYEERKNTDALEGVD